MTVDRDLSARTRYLLAIGIFGAALGLRFLVLPVEAGLAFLIFYPGTAVAALLCGLMPSVLYILLAAVVGAHVFLPPYWSLDGNKIVPACAFILSATTILLVVNFYQRRVARQTQTLTDEMCARQRLAGQLQESVDRLTEIGSAFREAQSLARVGNWTWDVRTDAHTWSEEIYLIYGRDPALPPAVYPEVQTYFTPDSWARLAAAVEKGLAEGVAYECDAEVVRPDGTHRWITARGEAVRDAEGKVLKLHGTVQDITERRAADEEIRNLNASLEQRVQQRTAELTAANKELDAFAYAVSHDLRAPLRAMSGFSQALVEDYGDRLEGEAKIYLDQIGIASRKMGELIDGILALSRSTRGDLQREAIDLSALAASILADLARTEPGRAVATSIEPGLAVHGDARMIEAAMRNLLGNAWKYTARTPAPAIEVCSGEVEGRRGICVADNGAGFNMAHADQLFQPFRRLHRQDEFPGVGIGLANVQRIIQRHGGKISAVAAPGAGATFCFFLPSQTAAMEDRRE